MQINGGKCLIPVNYILNTVNGRGEKYIYINFENIENSGSVSYL